MKRKPSIGKRALCMIAIVGAHATCSSGGAADATSACGAATDSCGHGGTSTGTTGGAPGDVRPGGAGAATSTHAEQAGAGGMEVAANENAGETGDGGTGGGIEISTPCGPVNGTYSSTLDLRDVSALEVGTCATFNPGFKGISLPDDPAQYPVRILLPPLTGPDPACLTECPTDVPTSFGIAFEDNQVLANLNLVFAILAPDPWVVTSGGCGEACPYPCLGGYQEFGAPSQCRTPARMIGFGIATAESNVRPLVAFVDLVSK